MKDRVEEAMSLFVSRKGRFLERQLKFKYLEFFSGGMKPLGGKDLLP